MSKTHKRQKFPSETLQLRLRRCVSPVLVSFVVLVGLSSMSGRPSESEYIRTEKFHAVRLTYDDLASLISRIHQFVGTADAGAPLDGYHSEVIVVSDRLSEVRIKNDFSLGAFAGAPQESSAARYSYSRNSAPISTIDIYLNDYQRAVTVGGNSPDQVEALLSLLAELLHSRETYLGGFSFRTWSGVLLLLLVVALVYIGAHVLGQKGKPKAAVWLLVVGAFIAILISILPWENWFPGTAVFATSASFLVRYSAQISMIGTLASLIALSIPGWKMLVRVARQEEGLVPKKVRRGNRP
jgi:hypothetical protein